MLGSPAGPGGASQRGLWPLAPAPAPPAPSFTTDGFGRYGVYSLFPGGPSIGGALYSHASAIGRFSSGISPTSGAPYAAHKETLFSSAGYTFGSPTPPPGSPYSPVAATHQLELLTKGFNSSNIIIHQPDYPHLSPKKYQIQEKRCDEKCYVKSENPCNCHGSPNIKPKFVDVNTGCSRTNPIDWGCLVNVKKEPGSTPCQVAEISTSVSPIVKIEVTSPSQKPDIAITSMPSVVTTNGNIPVGIAVARQRIQHHHHDLVSSPSLPPAGLLTTVNTTTHIKEFSRLSEIDSAPGMAASTTTGVAGGGAVLQCTEDRTTGLAGWSVGGSHNSTIATPTLWQYPTALPMEPMLPVPPVGVQLVRDPSTGHLLLLPTTGIEQVQQAVVWPSYHQPPSLFLPPLPPPPLQLLSSASSDYLSTSTTLHQHTQTHSTRLLALTTTDTKRKIPLPIPATTLIKIETDPSNLDQTKALQAVSTIGSNTGTVYTDQNMAPLVTTHVIYQHPTNLILSQASATEASHRSQATSPVSCLTPPPETTHLEDESPGVQDASNQTDSPICSEDDNTTICEISDTKGDTDDNKEEIVPEIESQSPKCDDIIINLPEIEEIQEQEEPLVLTSKPDLSGLELLSNSIVEFEKICTNSNISQLNNNNNINVNDQKENEEFFENAQDMSIKIKETESVIANAVDDKLGGLDLLCALAEQRFIEEVEVNNKKAQSLTKDYSNDKKNRDERKREKRKAKHYDESFSKIKKFKREYKKYLQQEEERKNKLEIERAQNLKEESERNVCETVYKDAYSEKCSCKESVHRTYKSRESEEEAKKFIASKTQPNYNKDDWPEMNPSELDMRLKLAELQRQYKEKQRELNKLKPKRKSLDEKESKKRKSRKKSTFSERSATPPPFLDKMDVPVTPHKYELLKPPTLCAVSNNQETNIFENKKETNYSSGPDFSDSSPEKISSSKKRKVGRPKKLLSSNDERTGTETIVAKKPKAGSFVGYLLAAKQKLQMQNKEAPIRAATPPRYVEEPTKKPKAKKLKHNNSNHTNTTKKLPESVSKIRPKLKAEPTVKMYVEDEEVNNDWESNENENNSSNKKVVESEIVQEVQNVPSQEETKEEVVSEPVKLRDDRCVLTAEHLEKDKMRVLTAMGGLFYAGHLKAVEPPDVYSISLDGERGNRPHIMSREEILRDAIVEVAPTSTKELTTGTRVCAYWSQQYRCLYPGSIAEPGTPDPILDLKFVSVEFDDGDSGRIAMEDIRYLPSDYPFVEYDPNPLLSLSKRRRRTSLNSISIDERRLSDCFSSPPQTIPEVEKPKVNEMDKENEDKNKLEQSTAAAHQERKRLKKRKREKLRDKLKDKLAHLDKKKHKKCKCGDEHCKRKKHHKKHKKHKKRHRETLNGDEKNQVEVELEKSDTTTSTSEDVLKEDSDDSPQSSLVHSTSTTLSEPEIEIDPENEVTIDDINDSKCKKLKKRDRQESSESRSKMTAFLYKKQLWSWSGKGYKRSKVKGRIRKEFFKEIRRDSESIMVGDSAVFLSTSSPDRPYIGKIQAMWESAGSMAVKVKWFYHPEETKQRPNLQYPGALFESPHEDENDVQTISHKCEVLSLAGFKAALGDDTKRYAAIYDNNDIYYLAGHYDPTTEILKIEENIPGNTN